MRRAAPDAGAPATSDPAASDSTRSGRGRRHGGAHLEVEPGVGRLGGGSARQARTEAHEQDEETHELVGDAELPEGWTIE